MEQFIRRQLNKLSSQQKALFASVFITGFFAHGYVLFNKLAYHDGILATDNLAATFNLGRWSLGLAEVLGKHLLGVYNMPLFHGVISIFFIACAGILLTEMLRIRSNLSAVYVGAIMSVFPVVTSIFAYMYTSSYYWLGMFLCVLAVYLLYRKQSVVRLIFSAGLIAVGLGLYQAYLAVAITAAVMSLTAELMENADVPVWRIIKKGFWYLAGLLSGLVGYLVLNKITIIISGIGMSPYQGTDEMGKIMLTKIPGRIWAAYYNFLLDLKWDGINDFKSVRVLIVVLLITGIIDYLMCVRMYKGKKCNKLLLLAVLFFFPLIVNSAYLFSTSSEYQVHVLMRYSLVTVLIFPVILMEQFDKSSGITTILQKIMSALLWVIVLCYIYVDNAAYLKMDFVQEQATAYYTVLISEIKGTEGYRDELPVAFIGERAIQDDSLVEMPFFDNITLDGYHYTIQELLNDYAWRFYIGRKCGYLPKEVELTSEYASMKEVQEMPCYPDKGSIKVVDNTVVIKFSE